MKYTKEKAEKSNYRITLELNEEELDRYKNIAITNLKKNQKDESVELDSEYVEMSTVEEIVHTGSKMVIEQNGHLKFIGNIYNLNRDKKDSITYYSYFLDVYPEIKTLNDDWQNWKPKALAYQADQQEVDDVLYNLRRQYADFVDIDEIEEDTIINIKRTLIDQNDKVISDHDLIIESKDWYKQLSDFELNKKGELVKKQFSKDTIPELLIDPKIDTDVEFIIVEIINIKKVVLPEFNKENIIKFFGNKEVDTKEKLEIKIHELITKQKIEITLMEYIEAFLRFSSASFEIIIPRTLIFEELKTRFKSLEDRMGGEEALKKYFHRIGKEESEAMRAEIQVASEASLEKFFLLKFLTEEKMKLENLEWKTPLAIELKVYGFLNKDLEDDPAYDLLQKIVNKAPNKKEEPSLASQLNDLKKIGEESKSKSKEENSNKKSISGPSNLRGLRQSETHELNTQNIDANPAPINSLFNFKEFIHELKDFERESIINYEKLNGEILGTMETQLWCVDYINLFETVPYKIMHGYQNSFDWNMLLRLVAGSFKINCELKVDPETKDALVCYVKDTSRNIDGNISELNASQILTLFEDTVEENISLQNQIQLGAKDIVNQRNSKVVEWKKNLIKIKAKLNPPQKKIEKDTSERITDIISRPKILNEEDIPKEFPIPKDINVSQDIISKEYKLVYLIINSKTLAKFNRQQSTIDNLSTMSLSEKENLTKILFNEVKK